MTIKLSLQNEELARVPVQYQPYPPRRILVVEDEPEIRRLNAVVLTDSGYEVDTADDGMMGWYALHATCHAPDSYDLLITDYNMPGLTGLDLVERLRAAHMALPVIMASGTLPMEKLMNRNYWLTTRWLLCPSLIPSSNCWERWKPFCEHLTLPAADWCISDQICRARAQAATSRGFQ